MTLSGSIPPKQKISDLGIFTLEAGDLIEGDASAADVVDYTISGVEEEAYAINVKALADGQLPAAKGTLYTTPASTSGLIKTITLVNTDSSARTVNLYLKRDGTNSRRIIPENLSLAANGGSLLLGPEGLQVFNAAGNILTSGDQGATGPSGPGGSAGVTGPSGPSGAGGSAGVTGPSGSSGATGDAGVTGPSGPSGATGGAGVTGPSGPAAGVTGPSGPAGSGGPSGPAGTSAVSGYSITVEDPSDGEDISIAFTNRAITVTEMRAVLIGTSNGQTVTWTIRHHATDRSNAGNEVVTAGTTTTSLTAGSDVTAFNDATIPADSFIWLETTAQGGTVTELHITIVYTVD